MCNSECGGLDRGPAADGDHGAAAQDHLGDRQQAGPELHHPPLQAQALQRRDHQVSQLSLHPKTLLMLKQKQK